MPLRLTATALGLPAGFAATVAILGLGRWLANVQGLRSPQLLAAALVLLAALAYALRLSGRRAAESARPLRGAGLGLAALGAWSLGLSYAVPAAGAHLPTGLFGAIAHALVLLPGAFGIAWAVPHLVRAAVPSAPVAPRASGLVLGIVGTGIAAGFAVGGLLAPELGFDWVARAAGFTALGTALLLLLSDQPLPHGSAPPPDTELGRVEEGGYAAPLGALTGFLFGGAFATWHFLLVPLAGSTADAATVIGACGFGGLALGVLLGATVLSQLSRPDVRLLTVLTLAGYAMLLCLTFFSGLPVLLLGAGDRTAALWTRLAAIVVPGCVLTGAALQLALRVRCAWTGTAASASGALLALAGGGALIGIGAVRHFVLPLANPTLALLGVGGLTICGCALLRLRTPHPLRAVLALVTVLPLGALVVPGLLGGWMDAAPTPVAIQAAREPLPPGLQLHATSHVPDYARFFTGGVRTQTPQGAELARMRGFDGPVHLVARPDGAIRIVQSGRTLGQLATGLAPIDRAEVALGLLPALLHKRPSNALVLGAGSGVTTEALLGARVGRVRVVADDIAGVQLADAYRGRETSVLADPRVQLERGTPRGALDNVDADGYSIVVAGAPFDPRLYTAEGLTALQAHLVDDGALAALWLPYDGFDRASIERVLHTIRSVFAEQQGYRFSDCLIVLVGARLPSLTEARFGTLLESPSHVGRLAQESGIGSRGALVRHLAFDARSLTRLMGRETPLLRDATPWLAARRALRVREGNQPGAVDDFLNLAFPPDVTRIFPAGAARDAWVGPAVEAWIDENPFVATVWDQAIPYGATPEGWRVRAQVASLRGEPDLAARFLGLAVRAAGPDAGRYAAMQIEALTATALQGKRPANQVRQQVQALATRHGNDARVLAAYGAARKSFGDFDGSSTSYRAALRATKPPPGPGVGIALAQVLMTSAEPDLAEVRDLLAKDPGLLRDVEALDLYVSVLEPEAHGKQAADLEAAADGLRAEEALRRIVAVRRWIAQHRFNEAAEDAARITDLQPTRTSAWILRALVDFGRAGLAAQPAARAELQRAAGKALQEAVRVSLAPAQTRARAARIQSWFGYEGTLDAP